LVTLYSAAIRCGFVSQIRYIYFSKTAIKQSHSSIYASFVDLPICCMPIILCVD